MATVNVWPVAFLIGLPSNSHCQATFGGHNALAVAVGTVSVVGVAVGEGAVDGLAAVSGVPGVSGVSDSGGISRPVTVTVGALTVSLVPVFTEAGAFFPPAMIVGFPSSPSVTVTAAGPAGDGVAVGVAEGVTVVGMGLAGAAGSVHPASPRPSRPATSGATSRGLTVMVLSFTSNAAGGRRIIGLAAR